MTTWKGESGFSVNFLAEKNFLKVFLCLMLPQYGRALKDGQNFLNSCCQLNNVLLGATIKNGPHTFLVWETWASNAIAWIVLPKPISSAKIPLIPCSNKLFNHLKPLIWYSLRVPRKEGGVLTISVSLAVSTEERSKFSYGFANFYKFSCLLLIIWFTVSWAAYSSISIFWLPGNVAFSSYFLWSTSIPSLVAMKWE